MSTCTMRKLGMRGALLATFALSCGSALGQNNPKITFNEFGYGTLLFPGGVPITMPCQFKPDPGPGGLSSVLFCNLLGPPSLAAGDLVILDSGGAVSDLLRFDPTAPAGFFIYSSNSNGVTAPADVGIPSQRNTNVLTINETGTATNNGVTYTPAVGQPGFVAGFSPTYTFLSDVPSPILTKKFGELAIPVGGTTSLTFALTNGNTALTGLTFSDALPVGLIVSTPNGLTGSCGGGTITATAGSGAIKLTGAALAAGAACTFGVNVTGIAAGPQNNTTSIVNSDQAISGNGASASISVGATNVTSQVGITVQPFLPDRSSRNPSSCTVVTVNNPNLPPDRASRSTGIPGPLELVLTNLSPYATLENPAGMLGGNPYVLLQPSSLPPGGQANASLCFLDSTGGPINFTPLVYSGAVQ